jgi:hypothetical protein
VIVFPPSTAVTVVIDGTPVRAYCQAHVRDGRTLGPPDPFITRVADRIWYEGDRIVVQRGARIVRMTPERGELPLAPVLRALGARVSFANRRLFAYFPRRPIATPSPFDAQIRGVSPRVVFTPEPVTTPRPVWTGVPLPRRTPLPVTVPTPAGRRVE